jgi:aminoglycoside phosphotransferase (APT) family kinase protein
MNAETCEVKIPARGGVVSFDWLGDLLRASPDWDEGAVRVLSAVRIGEAHGFSGRIHRVFVEAASRRTTSLVIKEESAEAVERELLVRRHLGDDVLGAIPRCYAGAADPTSGRGMLVLEDVTPATQGDILEGCSWDGADTAVRALARLHAATWCEVDDFPNDLPRWRGRAMDAERWGDRLARARARFPDILTAELVARLRELPKTVDTSLARLRDGPAAWIQADAHLDNILWRLDGSAVVLDWCNAAIGPPAVDVAGFLNDGVKPQWRQLVIASYAEELARHGVEVVRGNLETRVALALPQLLQGIVGWAGRDDLAKTGRRAATCRSALSSITSWTKQSGSHMGGLGA